MRLVSNRKIALGEWLPAFVLTQFRNYYSWHESSGVVVDNPNASVDCSNVVMSNGRGYVRASMKCNICGMTTGLKAQCGDSNCRARGEKKKGYAFHITCARQAGLETLHDEKREPSFLGKPATQKYMQLNIMPPCFSQSTFYCSSLLLPWRMRVQFACTCRRHDYRRAAKVREDVLESRGANDFQ